MLRSVMWACSQVGTGETERSHDDRYYLVLFRLIIYIHNDKINIKTIYTKSSYNQYSITVVSNFISTSIKMFWILIWMWPTPCCRLSLKRRSVAFPQNATKKTLRGTRDTQQATNVADRGNTLPVGGTKWPVYPRLKCAETRSVTVTGYDGSLGARGLAKLPIAVNYGDRA